MGLLDPQPQMTETPRKSALWGALSDFLAAANNYAQRPDPSMPMGKANPVLSGLANFSGLPAVQETAGRIAYGERLTQGSGQTMQIRPEVVDAGLAVAPIAANFPRATLGAGLGLLGVAGAVGDAGAADRAMLLFHGTNRPGALTIREGGASNVFDGVFASPSKSSALSHGDYLHSMDVPNHLVMGSGAPDVPAADIDAALSAVAGRAYSAKTKDTIWRAVIDDDQRAANELVGVLGDDIGSASWEAQRLRGAVAEKLGFKAAAMSDEHGTSYLVRPGVATQLIDSPAPVAAMTAPPSAMPARQTISFEAWRSLPDDQKAALVDSVLSGRRLRGSEIAELAKYKK
jgi:hypothetical protein